MAPLKCVELDDCRRPDCDFVHPSDPKWQSAGESRVYRDRKAAGTLGRNKRNERGSGPRSQRERSTTSADERGKSTSSRGWGSPDPPASSAWGASSTTTANDSGWGTSGGRSDGGWGNTSGGGGWDSTTTGGGGWGDSAKAGGGGGWGDSNTTTPTTATGGWGDSAMSGGWADANTSEGWGDSGSRRSSTSFDRPKSPRGGRDKPASSDRSVSSSKGKDRERDNDRDRRHDRDTSPSRPHRTSSSTETASSLPSKERRDNPRSPEHRSSTAKPNDAMDIDPPSAVTPSLSSAKETTTPTTPSTEMPISIPFARPAAPLGAAPLGSAPRTASLLSSQAPVMAPPPLPSTSLPSRQATVTATAATTIPTTTTPTPLAVAPASKPPSKLSPPPPVHVPKTPTPTAPSPDRPYEWIGLLQDVIKQNRTLKLAKQQVDHSQSLETPSMGRDPPGMGSVANSLSRQRAHVETLERDMQALLAQFAAHFEQFAAGKAGPAPVINGTGKDVVMDDGTLRQLSDHVSRLQSEFKLLEAEREVLPDLRKVADEAKRIAETVKKGVEDVKKATANVSNETKGLQDAVRKEQDARAKGLEDVSKEVKVLGEDVRRVKVESDRSREDLGQAATSLEQIRCDVQVLRDEQAATRPIVDGVKTEVDSVKQEVQTVRTGAESTKAEVDGLKLMVGQVKIELGGVSNEVGAIRTEVDKLKKELAERQVPATPKAKRNRNGITPPASDAMDVDEPRPAKRPRTGDATASPRAAVVAPQPDPQRLQDLEDYVSHLENELVQIGADVKERLDEFGTRIGAEPVDSLVAVPNQPEVTARGGSAPPGSSPKVQIARTPGRSSAPPQVGPKPVFKQQLEDVGEEDESGVRRDLSAVMGQMVKLWGAEGEWPGVVGRNLCKVLKVESLDEIKPKKPKAVNGGEEGEVVDEGLAVQVRAMREEMRKEREEHAKRMDAMLQRLERTESVLERVVKEREALAEENRAIKVQQAEQSKLLAHIQSVMDNLPRPQNGALSPEALAHDALRNGTSPVQREVDAIRRLAVIVPSLMSLAGVSE